MKRVLKWLGVAIVVPVLLVLLLAALLYVPPVQNWAVRQVARVASRETGMDISVEHVRLEFPLRLGVEGVRVLRPNPVSHERDTVASIGKAVVDVRLKPLFDQRVEIDQMDLQNVSFNTTDFVKAANVSGRVGRLALQSHGIDLKGETLKLDDVLLADANVSVLLADSVPEDTTASDNQWKILVGQLKLERSHVAVHWPADTMSLTAYLGHTEVGGGDFDLGKGTYRVRSLQWTDGALSYDNGTRPPVADGFDHRHIALGDIRLSADSISYAEPKLFLRLLSASMQERSGLRVDSLSGSLAMDSARLYLPDLLLRTADSRLDAHLSMDLDAFSDSLPGQLHLRADAAFGKQDLMRFLGSMPQDFVRKWPNAPLTLKTVATGNLEKLNFAGLNVQLPGAFRLNASGMVARLTDANHLSADLQLDAQAYRLDFVEALLPSQALRHVRIPSGIGLKGKVRAEGPRYVADVVVAEGSGRLQATADIDTRGDMRYQARLKATNLQLSHFLPAYDVGTFTGALTMNGSGTDVFSKRTQMQATADIERFSFGEYNLNQMGGTVHIRSGRIVADLHSQNPLVEGQVSLDALMNVKDVQAHVTADLQHADLYGLHLTEAPATISLVGNMSLKTDLKDYYEVAGRASQIALSGPADTYIPDDIVVDLLTQRDTTHAVVSTGDFYLDMDAGSGYRELMKVGERLTSEIQRQLKEKKIDQQALRRRFPEARIALQSGNDNFFTRLLQREGYTFRGADIRMRTSAVDGLNGRMEVLALMKDSILLDTVRVAFVSDTTNITFNGQIRNNRKNPQFVFNTLFDGYLIEKGAGLTLRYYDQDDRLGVRLGAEALMEEGGIRLHMMPQNAVIAYRTARINDDNYVFLADNRRVSARLNILADDGTGLKIYSDDSNAEVLQDLTLSLNRFNLEEISSILPYFPRMTGFVNGDYHIVQRPEQLSVSSSMTVDDLTYEGNAMGNVGTDFVYMPADDGSHYVDGLLFVEGNEVATIEGTYRSEGKGFLDATVGLEHLPMSLVNGFVPDQLMGLKGYGKGELDLKGPLSEMLVNGSLKLDSCHLVSVPYGMDLRFSDKPVRIVGSKLLLEDFAMYAYNDTPLTLNGQIDFADFSHVAANIRMMARNFLLINAKENIRSVAFGKAFVNFFGMLSGEISNLQMRGKLDVLGTTDVSYVLRDSPLTTDNQLDELVKFTDFNDTTQTVVRRPPLNGFNMDLTVDVAQGAHVMAYLNSDHSNYIDLMGGGTLRMRYNPTDNLRLTGRYTLANGEMKYSLPVIPLKTFTIQDGSYIEFTGDAMNPTLHITATERNKATVTGTNGIGTGVDFDCGVVITQTLNNMGLEFTLDAPENMTLHNELQQMSKEQRGKLAVTMLTTGMYLADGNTKGFSMNSALSSYLESEINNITGNALQTIGLSMNLDNATDASGAMHTDYNFKFARRFWNNRLKISIGGKVSTGAQEAYGQNASFFDNATLEYRLDDTANKYVKLFFENNYYDWLEGYTQQYGGGFVWRRTLQHFKDIFRFKNDNQFPAPPRAPQDSTALRPETVNATDEPTPQAP